MTLEKEISKLAIASGYDKYEAAIWLPYLERFYALVVAKEREECAKVCESRYMGDNNREDMEAKRCAEAIRRRVGMEEKDA